MRIAFIIAEYNPLHNGHIKHIAKTKEELCCDKIVCIMSGDVMQRGEVAIVDKYTRATWAIEAGADMVVELPCQYSLGSAQVFATGASKIIDMFDAEKYLSFGSECGSEYVLEKIAQMLMDANYQEILKEKMKDKNSYAKASFIAFEKYLEKQNIDTSIAQILTKPNNTLAIEYIKAMQSISVNFFTIKREGDFEQSLDIQNPSANSIRKLIEKRQDTSLFVPSFVQKDLSKVKFTPDKLFSIIKYEFAKKTNLEKIFGMNEGIHNRFLNNLKNSETYDEFIDNVKTKRFTRTSLNRAILSALLDNTYTLDSVIQEDLEYINILAIKDSAKDLLSLIELDIVTKPSELEKLCSTKNIDCTISKKATQLFKSVNYEYESFMRIIK